jgi:homoserine trans-succinylase
MTSSLCTVVNFSRVNLEEQLSQDLKETFIMPVKNITEHVRTQLPDETQIQQIVEKARAAAVLDLKNVGIFSNCYSCQLSGTYEEDISEDPEDAPPDDHFDEEEEPAIR